MLRLPVRRPAELRLAFRLGLEARDGLLLRDGLEARLPVFGDRFVDPEREGLDRFTLEPLLADRPPDPLRRCAAAASESGGSNGPTSWSVSRM